MFLPTAKISELIVCFQMMLHCGDLDVVVKINQSFLSKLIHRTYV
jgi:hypothetical protein